jgi:hypothetical protein
MQAARWLVGPRAGHPQLLAMRLPLGDVTVWRHRPAASKFLATNCIMEY